jgi:hypothetical protein
MIKTTNTPFNNKRLTKVSWQEKLETWSEDLDPVVTGTKWVTWTTATLMPWCFKASTIEETIKAAHSLKFGYPMESLTPNEDGSFLMTYQCGTLRVVVGQEAYVKPYKSEEQIEEEMADFQNDLERDLAFS